jgi:arginine repressor
VAGTISGDDTLFLALRDGVDPGAVAKEFRELASET